MLYFPKWKIVLVISLCLIGFLTALPNVFHEDQLKGFPGWLPSKQINLGLDLRGGAHLLLEVDTQAVVTDRVQSLQDSIRDILRPKRGDERIGYTGIRSSGSTVSLQLTDPAQATQAVKLIRTLAAPTGGNMAFGGGSPDIEVEASDDGKISVTLTEVAIEERIRSAVGQSIEIVRRRVDEMGTREPSIQRQGDDRILVQVPGIGDPGALKAIIGKTAKMDFRMVDTTMSVAEAMQGRVPPGSEILEGLDGGRAAGDVYLVRKRVLVSGESLVDAQPSFQDNQPVVSFRFDTAGAKRFAEATTVNVNKPFAIILDNKVISAPRINEPIRGGSGIISGNFTVESANELALLLRAGALPAPLTVMEERTVGPDLGADSVRAGEIAAIIGLAAVLVFMMLSYGFVGLIANFALGVNIVLIFGALSVLQATLTLPGIAGIVLTIGMAVDANVLVFERIREELRAGRSVLSSVEAGYSKAMSTILDANITTLIAAAILYEFGSGPVKGFAVTLTVGIITSVFSAVTLTRLVLAVWLRRRRPQTLEL